MTMHITYDHQCAKCGAFYIPYDEVPCPNCGLIESERFDFIPQAADSAMFNLEEYQSYVPPAWWTGSYGDHILSLLFSILEQQREEPDKPFPSIARSFVDEVEWGDQGYGKEHLYNIAIRVHEQIEIIKSNSD